MDLKDVLKGKLEPEELDSLKTSFDIIGDVAIMEIPEELENREKIIAEGLMKVHKHVKTVCKKATERKGKERLRELKVIAGDGTETVHKEHGCRFKLNVKGVYFSPRESTERQRIAEQVKPDETVLVMFAGVGPYVIEIAKKQPEVNKVYGIEINERAYNYMKMNVKMNQVQTKVETILGDVKEMCEGIYEKCDRVVMPLPLDAYKYLDVALKCLGREGGIVHFYSTGPEEDLFGEAETVLKEKCEKNKKNVKVIDRVKVLPYAPGVWKVCIDAEID